MQFDNFISLEDFIHLFLPYFLLSICFLVGVFLIGLIARSSFFLQLKHKLNTVNLFYNLFVGIVVIVFIVSLYKTNFHSINILFLLVGLGFFYKRKELIKDASKITSKKINLVFISIIYILIYTVYFSLIYQRDAVNLLSNFMADDLYYSLISYHIYNQGIENMSHVGNYVTESQDIVPIYYHYFELWLTGLFNTIDGQNINQTFILYTSTLITFIASSAIYFIFNVFFDIKNKILYVLMCLFFLLSPTYFFFYEKIFGNSLDYQVINLLFGRTDTVNIKYAIILIPSILAFYFLLRNKLFISSVLISSIIIINVITAPTLCVFLLGIFIYAKINNNKDTWQIFVYDAFFCIFFVSFYYFIGTFKNPVEGKVDFPFWKDVYFYVRLTFSLTIKNIIIYFPYIFILLVCGGKTFLLRHKKIIVLYLMILLGCGFAGGIFYKKINYLQITNLTASIITFNFFIYCIGFLIKDLSKKNRNILLILFGLLSVYNLYLIIGRVDKGYGLSDTKFVNQIKSEFEGKKEIWGVSIFEIKQVEPYSIISTYVSPFNFLSTIHSGTFAISLSHYGLTHTTKDPIDSMNVEWELQKDPFTIFIQKQKSQNSFVSLNQSRLDFVLKYRPKFLAVLREELLPVNFTPYLGKRITNSNNSVIIYLLNYEK